MLDPDKRKLARLEKTKKNVLNRLTTGLEKASPGLGKEYIATRKDYGQIMGPYLKSKAFEKLLSGDSGDKKFLSRLIKEEPFMTRTGRTIPELKHRELLPEYLKRQKNIHRTGIGTAIGIPTLGGLYKGYTSMFGDKHE